VSVISNSHGVWQILDLLLLHWLYCNSVRAVVYCSARAPCSPACKPSHDLHAASLQLLRLRKDRCWVVASLRLWKDSTRDFCEPRLVRFFTAALEGSLLHYNFGRNLLRGGLGRRALLHWDYGMIIASLRLCKGSTHGL